MLNFKLKATTKSGGDPFFSQTELLLPLDGANGSTTTADASPRNLTVTMTSCSLTTTAPKFGSACASMGVNSNISASVAAAGTGQFIVQGWFYLDAVGSTQVLWVNNNYTTANGYEVYVTSGGALNLYGANGAFTLASASGVVAAGAWQLVSCKRNSSNVVSLWVGSTQVASGTWANSIGSGFTLGGQGGSLGFLGKADDIRITNGTDRGASVTVPSSAWPTH